MEEVRALVIERLEAGGGEVLRVDELVAVAAVADDPDFFVVVDELEEDGEEAEAAAVDDGGAADGDDIEIVGVFGEDLFSFEFGAAVELDGIGCFVFGDVVAEIAGPEAVAGDEDELFSAGIFCRLGEVAGAVDVGGPEEVVVDGVVGELCGAVEDGGEFLCGQDFFEERSVAYVGLNAAEVGVGVGIGDEVDVGAGVAFVEETALEDSAEEAGASGDEDMGH